MTRIAVGGFQHETNTFAPIKADYAAFERADSWPALASGKQMLDKVHGVHLPITGAINALRQLRHEIVPLTWCSATPCAHITEDAFERIAKLIIDGIAAAGKIDGIYLDLHGAAVCEHVDDAEGELLKRIRDRFGDDIPVAVSLDLHANVTPDMVEHCDVLEIFRTYPHVDMAGTGARAAAALHRLITRQEKWASALRHPNFLVPLNWGCTLIEPALSLYKGIDADLDKAVTSRSLAMGFPLSDIHYAGPAIVAYGTSQSAADDSADALLERVNAAEEQFKGTIHTPADAVDIAIENADAAKWPTLLVDTQDNPGGGGTGDTTGLLRAMVDANARGAVMATIYDPAMAAMARNEGPGSIITGELGGRLTPGDSPLFGDFRVLTTAPGEFNATGPMYSGARMVLGPMAVLEFAGVRAIVASHPEQVADQAILRHVDIEAAHEPIVGLKSSVHFRNDFQKLSADILLVAAPGVVLADVTQLEFRNLRDGVRR